MFGDPRRCPEVEIAPARAAERLVDSLPWLLLHDEVSKSWIEETKGALDAACTVSAAGGGAGAA